MADSKTKSIKKYGRILKKPDAKESELNEADRELSEDARETQEGSGIEEEEETGEEVYPEIEEELGHEDNPDKEDE